MGADWQIPTELPDLRRAGIVALDTETCDGGLQADRGSGWPWSDGYICGVSVAWHESGAIRACYVPIKHPDSQNFDRDQVFQWLRDLIASDVRIVGQNSLYDFGWLRAEADIGMPPSERLEEIGALATLIDENRFNYGLDALCAWRGLPGKDTALLLNAVKTAGWEPRKRIINVAKHIYKLPAALVGPYAEADAIATLALFETLNPILDQESTRDAYRLDVDLLPMVHEMRRRGIRIDQDAAEQARKYCFNKRDRALAELSEHLGNPTGMEEIAKPKWKAKTFDAHGIGYPRTPKNNPSFKAGKLGWMAAHAHWLPQLIATASKYDAAGSKFIEGHILAHLVGGRIYGEINPFRSEDGGGTKSFRFSYSNPPLQQMPSRDPELGPLIRSVFLPEDGEVWCTVDCSQQEFRFVTHYAGVHNLKDADEAIERYSSDPDTDFHALVSDITTLPRKDAKNVNFAKMYGAGEEKFAEMIGKPVAEARRIRDQYDRRFPFLSQLAEACQREANRQGYTLLYDGARRHWDRWATRNYAKGAGPCSYEEGRRRITDPGHPWYGGFLHRVDIRTAMNALIQGSAARHTKLWMRACWREGIVPMLQMHDGLELSVTSQEQGELVAQLACEAVDLKVPMRADQKFGRNWGDAQHTWQELQNPELSAPSIEPPSSPNDDLVDVASVPFMITRAMKERLSAGGFSEDQIAEMTPQQAHDQIGLMPSALPLGQLAAEEQPEEQSAGRSTGSNDGGGPTKGNGRGYPWEERAGKHKAAEFIYRDLKGVPYLRVDKYTTHAGRKSCLQYRWENGRWESGKPKGPAIPYRLPELLAAPTGAKVWICEGEKDADTLTALGLIATTNPGGAGKWGPELAKWLAGFTTAYVLEDNDTPGRKHVLHVAAALSGVIPDIRVLAFRELPEHGDVTDWLATGRTLEQLWARAEQAPKFAALESSRAEDEDIEALDWIWPGRYAIGKIGLLVGLPDEGKGLTLSDIMARITRGSPWPCNEGQAPLGNVVLLTAEDDINDTIIPRLIAAGADLHRVTIVKMMHEAGAQRMFSLVSDLGALRHKVVEIGDVKMILIDPITAYLGIGKVDSFRATDVRAVLGPLKEFAAELRLSILGVMHFNKKTDVTNVLLRISDSLAYGAAARHVYGVINDPDNLRKLFVKGKNNLAPRDQATLAFSFDDREVGTDKRTGVPIRAPFIVWHPDPVDITAVEAMQAAAESKSPSGRENVREFLEALLGNGPRPVAEVIAAGKENGFSERTLRRYKTGIVDPKEDGPLNENGRITWRWHLITTPKTDV